MKMLIVTKESDCVLQNAIGKESATGGSTSHMSSDNSSPLRISVRPSTLLMLMAMALSFCLSPRSAESL